MKTLRTGLAITFTLIFASFATAQGDPKTSEVLDEIMQKIPDVSSFEVDMEMKTQMMGQEMTVNSHMVFKQPEMMRVTTRSSMMPDMKQEMYSKDNIVWNYNPMMKMATKMDMSKIKGEWARPPNTDSILKPFSGLAADKVKYIEKKNVDGKDVYVFEVSGLMPGQTSMGQAPPQMFPDKTVVWISADTGLPYKTLMHGKDGSLMMEQTFSNFKTNISVDDSEFEFTPPEGVQVMDMTEGAINMMKQMEGSQPKSE